MKVLLVHPSPLMYSEIYLRLEPLGLERVAAVVRNAGHEVRLLDLHVFDHTDFYGALHDFRPDAVGFSLNYMSHVPEVVDLSVATKRVLPRSFVFVGGHMASFLPQELLEHSFHNIDCVVCGEGETTVVPVLDAAFDGGLETVPGAVTAKGAGPLPMLAENLDEPRPARDLTRRRNKYFIGILDPCASIEFSRGCPWNCSFCSAWPFYSRSYRRLSPQAIAEDMASIREPHVFVVDDVVFIRPEDGMAIGREVEKRNIKKRYYMETRCDILLKNHEVFEYWKRLGLEYMFLGVEAIDAAGLERMRKRVSLDDSLKALEIARKLKITVALNIIADPDWDEDRFRVIREWALEVPEIVHLTVLTPYPGTELWYNEYRNLTTRDYRLFDVQHAVLPTRLPLRKFYEELVKTQDVLNKKHLGFAALKKTFSIAAGYLMKGQTNFVQMLWKFNQVYNAERQYQDHFRPVKYPVRLPDPDAPRPAPEDLYVHDRTAGRRKSA